MDGKLYTVFGIKNQSDPGIQIKDILIGNYINETKNGIFSIEVTTYGDDLQNPYIEVQATNQDIAVATWYRVRDSLNTKLWYDGK